MTTPSGPQPADFADVRATNLAVVLRDVRAHAPCSRADIAARTGLNKATVSSLVGELIDRRLVRETGITEHRIGRPATMLVLDGSRFAAIGLEIGVDQVTVVALDLAGAELVSWRRASTAVAGLVSRAVARVAALDREVLALTVGVPGPVDAADNVPVLADLRRGLRDAPYDINVDSSVNLAVSAEHRAGEHAGTANLVYVSGDARVSAGLIVDGHLLRGARGFTGLLGNLDGLDERASIPAIVRAVLPDAEDDGPIVDYAPELDRVVVAARNGSAPAIKNAGRHLGRGLAALADLVDPEVILLGGGSARLAEWLVPAAAEALDGAGLLPGVRARLRGPLLNVSSLGPTAAALGGAMRALADVEGGHLPANDAVAAR
jgi:predicted NBD/HSP70 family sugar kinase